MGKGSYQRPGNRSKINDTYDKVFGAKEPREFQVDIDIKPKHFDIHGQPIPNLYDWSFNIDGRDMRLDIDYRTI